MIKLNVRVKAPLLQKLKSGEIALRDYSEALDTAGLYMLQSTMRAFRAQGYGTWAPLASYTIARRRKRGAGAKILQDTGRLRNSITHKRAPEQIYRLRRDHLIIGTTVPYASLHQFGSRTRRIPKRMFLRFWPGDERRIKQIFARYIRRSIQ